MKTKMVLIVIATLLIGFVIGFLVNGQITKEKIQTFVKQGTPEGFTRHLYHIIQPDAAQRKVIEPILDKYAVMIDTTVLTFRSEMNLIHTELVRELEPYLDKDQLNRLKNADQMFQRPGRGHRGPPPWRGGPQHQQ